MASQHWYDREGNPRYTVIGTNGKERDTTLRDAKKYNLLPSVSTILSCVNKPFLVQWQENQVLDAAWINPYRNGCVDEWKKQIKFASRQQAKDAADDGHRIHDLMERYYKINPNHPEMDLYDISEHDWEIVISVAKKIWTDIGPYSWVAEESFAIDFAGGFGGKCDLHTKEMGGIVVDFKTKGTADLSKFVAYNEHCMQLAAYRDGLGLPNATCYNVFISTTEPGVIKIHQWEDCELKRASKQFYHLLKYWRLVNKLENL